MSKPIPILVVGCGHQGSAHGKAYHAMPEFRVAGVVSRGPETRERLSNELGVSAYDDYYKAFKATEPEAVSINTYPDTHAEYAIHAMQNGAHIFLEKPLAETVEDAEAIFSTAQETGRKVVVGYGNRFNPVMIRFVEESQKLGRPLVMRMNLNQQGKGAEWIFEKNLMDCLAPLVDCGVHYVDMMCWMTGSKPLRVHAIGARLTDEVKPDIYNYGQLQVEFEDGSVGWYEAGWGPMMSETAHFIKDTVGPKGSVSIGAHYRADEKVYTAQVGGHGRVDFLQVHHAELDAEGEFAREDEMIYAKDIMRDAEPVVGNRVQDFFLKAIREDLDLTRHLRDAVDSLRIVLAADESVKTHQVVELEVSDPESVAAHA